MSASGGTPRSGTMSEPQVRAMFDRIAGFYDLMNSVMTAGLHHRWRARAADLAALGPGDSALDVACGTGDLAIELARRVGTGGEVIGSDFAEEMLERARAKDPGSSGSGATRSSCPTPAGASTPRRSASARATSQTSTAGWPRWRAWSSPAAASSCSRSPRRASRRCRPSIGCGSTTSCRSSGASRASRRPTPICRARSGASPARRGWPPRCSAPGSATSGGS